MKGILYELYRYAICKPGVDERNAPPLNASNLNDISNALQAVNITQQERTTLGAEATDTLGQILAALKTTTDGSIESISQDVEEIQQTMGNVKCVYGSYVGNGQTTLTITLGFRPHYIYMASTKEQMDSSGNFFMSTTWVYNNTVTYNSANVSSSITLLDSGITFSAYLYPEIILNGNGIRVYYMAFG